METFKKRTYHFESWLDLSGSDFHLPPTTHQQSIEALSDTDSGLSSNRNVERTFVKIKQNISSYEAKA